MANELDFTYLQSVLGDEDLIKELIETLYKDAPVDMQILADSLANGDVYNARIYSHKLKSSLAVFKIEPLRTSMETMEKMAREGSTADEIETIRVSILEEFNTLISGLKSYL